MLTGALLIAVVFILYAILQKDPGPALDASLVVQPNEFRPEPTERRIYYVVLLALPIATWFAFRVVTRRFRGGWVSATLSHPGAAVVLAALLLPLAIWLADQPFVSQFIGPPAGVGARQLVVIGVAVVAGIFAMIWPKTVLRRVTARRVLFALCVLLAVLAGAFRGYGVDQVLYVGRYMDHFETVLFGAAQSYAGNVPLVDFVPFYGLYGDLLAPLFWLVGLSVSSFTIVMGVLQTVSLTAIIFFAYRRLRNPALFVLFSIALVSAAGSGDASVWPPQDVDRYFQYWPVRFLFPALFVGMIPWWQASQSPKKVIVFSIFCGIGLLWNLDSGLPVWGAWLVLASSELFTGWRDPTLRRGILRRLGLSVAVTAGVILLYVALLCVRAGRFPDLSAMFHYQKLFVSLGYFMAPIPHALHPWQLVALLMVAAFCLGFAERMGFIKNDAIAALFPIAIMGCGLFAYYQGRSLDPVLTALLWPSVLILFLFADVAVEAIRDGRLKGPLGLSVVVAALFVGAGLTDRTIRAVPTLLAGIKEHIKLSGKPLSPVAANSAFIGSQAARGRKCTILAHHASVYYAENSLRSAIGGPPLAGYFLIEDGRALFDEIIKRPPETVFVERSFVDLVRQKFQILKPPPPNELFQRYALVATSPNGQLLHLRRKEGQAP